MKTNLIIIVLAVACAGCNRHDSRATTDAPSQPSAATIQQPARGEDRQSAHDLSVDVPDRVMVEAWRDDLHRLVLNLVENALRHTPPGTAVRVRTRDLGSRAELVG